MVCMLSSINLHGVDVALNEFSWCGWLISITFSQMPQRQRQWFKWTYRGSNKKFLNKDFYIPMDGMVVDDTDIFLKNGTKKGDRTFFISNIVDGSIEGYYFVGTTPNKTIQKHIRTCGHIRPSDEFRKCFC